MSQNQDNSVNVEKSIAQSIESLADYFDEIAAAHGSNHGNHHTSTADN